MEEKITIGNGGIHQSANELLEEHLRKTPETQAGDVKKTAEKYLQNFELYISDENRYPPDGMEGKRGVVSGIIEQGNTELKAGEYDKARKFYIDAIEKSAYYFTQIEESTSKLS